MIQTPHIKMSLLPPTFVLVTAYEDIRKRLENSKKENSFLKKKSKIFGRFLAQEQVPINKAYHANQEVCIDGDNLKSKLDKMKEDNSESLKVLNEQLLSK